MIYFELIFKYNVRCGFRFIFSLSFDIGISSCFKTFAEKLLFLHQLSLHVCKTLSCSCMWGSISLLFILIYLLILKSMPYCLYCYRFILSTHSSILAWRILDRGAWRATEWLTLHFYNVLKSGSVSFPNYWSLSYLVWWFKIILIFCTSLRMSELVFLFLQKKWLKFYWKCIEL